ncbi:MAG TPA: hypothetical protein VF765_22280 [Polyangiaceae bacterium]
MLMLPFKRASALLFVLAPLALAAHCGGAAFSSGGGGDASTGSSSGSSSGADASGSSSGGGPDAPACTPDTLDMHCNDCIAAHCETEWCDCVQNAACATYVGCRLRGNTVMSCAGACGCSVSELGTGDKLINCTTLHCTSECAVTSSSSSSGGGSGSGSSSGMTGSSSGGSSSSSGGSSSSSGGSSSSSGGSGSSSGIVGDAGSVCVCPACPTNEVCCSISTSGQCGQCYNPACGSCCQP